MRIALMITLALLLPVASAFGDTFGPVPFGMVPIDQLAGSSAMTLMPTLASFTPAMQLGDTSPNVCLDSAAFAELEALPNPAHTMSTVRFTLPEREHVSVRVFDRLGREVQTLLDEDKGAGRRSATLHATELPAGEYTVRVQMGTSCTETLVEVQH